MTKETKKDASEYFRDSFKGKNYWTKKLKPKYEHFSRACFLFILLRYKMHRMASHPDNIRKNSKQGGGESAAVTLFATDFQLVCEFLLTEWLQKESRTFSSLAKSDLKKWFLRCGDGEIWFLFVFCTNFKHTIWPMAVRTGKSSKSQWSWWKILTKSLNWIWNENHFVYL